MPKFFVIDLFSGSKSVSCKLASCASSSGFDVEVMTVDLAEKSNPTIVADVSTWKYRPALDDFLCDRKRGDIVWFHASPPCTEYSRAKTSAPRNLPLADKLARRTLRILAYARPTWFTLENPVGLMMERPFMRRFNRSFLKVVSYCRYGLKFRKHTCIWTNSPFTPLVCRAGDYCPYKRRHGRHRQTAQSGPAGDTPGSGAGVNVYPLPAKLIEDLYEAASGRSQRSQSLAKLFRN
jgi:hypothetical protein